MVQRTDLNPEVFCNFRKFAFQEMEETDLRQVLKVVWRTCGVKQCDCILVLEEKVPPWKNIKGYQRSQNKEIKNPLWQLTSNENLAKPCEIRSLQEMEKIVDLVSVVLDLGYLPDLCNPVEAANMLLGGLPGSNGLNSLVSLVVLFPKEERKKVNESPERFWREKKSKETFCFQASWSTEPGSSAWGPAWADCVARHQSCRCQSRVKGNSNIVRCVLRVYYACKLLL